MAQGGCGAQRTRFLAALASGSRGLERAGRGHMEAVGRRGVPTQPLDDSWLRRK